MFHHSFIFLKIRSYIFIMIYFIIKKVKHDLEY
jgi:hypothetical protein